MTSRRVWRPLSIGLVVRWSARASLQERRGAATTVEACIGRREWAQQQNTVRPGGKCPHRLGLPHFATFVRSSFRGSSGDTRSLA